MGLGGVLGRSLNCRHAIEANAAAWLRCMPAFPGFTAQLHCPWLRCMPAVCMVLLHGCGAWLQSVQERSMAVLHGCGVHGCDLHGCGPHSCGRPGCRMCERSMVARFHLPSANLTDPTPTSLTRRQAH
eukprot:358199-Chlamydomonas_euryale.AAC.1